MEQNFALTRHQFIPPPGCEQGRHCLTYLIMADHGHGRSIGQNEIVTTEKAGLLKLGRCIDGHDIALQRILCPSEEYPAKAAAAHALRRFARRNHALSQTGQPSRLILASPSFYFMGVPP